MVERIGSLDYDGETFSFVLMEYHYMPMRTAMDMHNQIVAIEIALARARRESKKTDREKLVLDPEDQACDKAETQEYTARKDPVIESRGRERPKKADEPTEGGENSIEVSNPMELDAMWRWLSGDDTVSKKRGKARNGKRKNRDGKGKTAEVKAENEPFDGCCTGCKKYGHKQQDCWARARENASGSTATVEKAEETAPATAGSLLYGDQEEYTDDKNLGWIFSISLGDQPEPGDILIDSGAAMSVCAEQRSETQPKGHGTALRTATGHRFDTLGATTMVLDCEDGLSMQSRFQVAPKNSGLKNTIISVGEMTDRAMWFCSAATAARSWTSSRASGSTSSARTASTS